MSTESLPDVPKQFQGEAWVSSNGIVKFTKDFNGTPENEIYAESLPTAPPPYNRENLQHSEFPDPTAIAIATGALLIAAVFIAPNFPRRNKDN